MAGYFSFASKFLCILFSLPQTLFPHVIFTHPSIQTSFFQKVLPGTLGRGWNPFHLFPQSPVSQQSNISQDSMEDTCFFFLSDLLSTATLSLFLNIVSPAPGSQYEFNEYLLSNQMNKTQIQEPCPGRNLIFSQAETGKISLPFSAKIQCLVWKFHL